MAIAKKPKTQSQPHSSLSEQAVEAFILGATTAPVPQIQTEEEKRKVVTLRFPPDALARVDAAAKKRGISRSAWIQFVVSRAIDLGEG